MVNIKLLFAILNDDKDKQMKSILNKNNINVQYVTHGRGTASPSVLDYFGLSETKKSIYFAIINIPVICFYVVFVRHSYNHSYYHFFTFNTNLLSIPERLLEMLFN